MSNSSQARSASKPNSTRRMALRASYSVECGTCLYPLDWSAETPDKAPAKGTIGHVVADVLGGTYAPGNTFGQCWACNWSAQAAGAHDLSADVAPGMVPTRYLSDRATAERADVRDAAPLLDAPDWQARKAARAARGLDW